MTPWYHDLAEFGAPLATIGLIGAGLAYLLAPLRGGVRWPRMVRAVLVLAAPAAGIVRWGMLAEAIVWGIIAVNAVAGLLGAERVAAALGGRALALGWAWLHSGVARHPAVTRWVPAMAQARSGVPVTGRGAVNGRNS
jgi:hypothetical protein